MAPESDFDINKVAAEFLNQNLERISKGASSGAKALKDHLLSRMKSTFRPYITRLLERHSRGKSFFVRTEAIPLYDFFVPLDLKTQARTLKAPSAEQLAAVAPFSIISGSGGSGKSMMMRHLLVSSIRSGKKTPIFIELRQLNQTSDTVKAALLRSMQESGFDVDESFFEIALKAGEFFVLLDGFDELDHASRKRIATEVRGFSQRYSKNWVAMSSRPDSFLEGWDEFMLFRICPLDLEAAISLVEKIPFDAAIQSRFIADMRAHLFERHKSFLSNPLLLSIMLLTYRDIAHIPHKLSAFYAQAYDSLFQRHDALKSGYQRDRKCNLDLQDFAKAFSAFSLLSYDKREFTFSQSRALELMEAARSLAMLEFDSDALLADSIQAACLLVEEGMEISFAHRSFQEYFVARFVHEAAPAVKERLVERFIPGVESDSVMSLLFELDPYTVEKVYLIPKLIELGKRVDVKGSVGLTHYVRFLRTVFKTIEFDEGDDFLTAAISDAPLLRAMSFAMNRYRPQIARQGRIDARYLKELRAAFVADHGSTDEIQVSALKVRGLFVKKLSEYGGVFNLHFLSSALQLESEIRGRHSQQEESLELVLARPLTNRRLSSGTRRG